ncbi:MAG: HAMP domain-containing histidine kinase [Anaerolineae bacterium]|nr:HAMP domain-containing histidine kinase [Anaerolineae bacterium]
MRWRHLLILLPLGVGLAMSAMLHYWEACPVFYARADAAALSVMAGLAFSLVLAAGWTVHGLLERKCRAALAQLQAQAADDRRRFLQRLDHELKNPLTALRAALANLAEAPTDAAWREAFVGVETQAQRLSRLVAELRKLADLETRPIEHAPVDLTALLEEALALARERPEAAARRLNLNLPRAPWPLPVIHGDRDLLFLTIHNLLDNALKFTRTGDVIELRAFEDGAMVIVEVADTGPGIPEEELPHVWEELYRGQGARGTPGSGLGLALVRAVVLRHGGQVALRSRVGQGTVVTVRLPAR